MDTGLETVASCLGEHSSALEQTPNIAQPRLSQATDLATLSPNPSSSVLDVTSRACARLLPHSSLAGCPLKRRETPNTTAQKEPLQGVKQKSDTEITFSHSPCIWRKVCVGLAVIIYFA